MASSSNANIRDLKDSIQTLEYRLNSTSSRDEALSAAMEAAQLCLKALKLAVGEEKTNLKVQAGDFIAQAEDIKKGASLPSSTTTATVSTPLPDRTRPTVKKSQTRSLRPPGNDREPTKKEQIIVLRASKLHSTSFPPWKSKGPPDSTYFNSGNGVPYREEELKLSSQQQDHFKAWLPASEALALVAGSSESTLQTSTSSPIDLVQDAISDCSVIASLCLVASREAKGFSSLLKNLLYPSDNETGSLQVSANGSYIARLNFNGSWRIVRIDDRLPASTGERILHTIDLNCPTLLWPALVEKAYLKVRGGYDFPGSNTCTDLWVLTGWIPEQIFVQDEETDLDAIWRRVESAHAYGDIMMSIGTGKLSRSTEKALGLASEHNYAVLDLVTDQNGSRVLTVKNPWLEIEPSRNALSTSTTDISASSNTDPAENRTSDGDTKGVTRIFSMSYESILQDFEYIYLSWNPGLFSHRSDVHFEWNLARIRSKSPNFIASPQFSITTTGITDVWLLLCRHFSDRQTEVPNESANGFISLYAFDTEGYRAGLTARPVKRSPYVDTAQVLLKLPNVPKQTTYTLVPSEQDMLAGTHSLTLIAFSQSPVIFDTAKDAYTHSITERAAWTQWSAGGNGQSTNYLNNPQFKISVPAPTRISLLLESENQAFHVNIKLLFSGGRRAIRIARQDIVLDSGDYRAGVTSAESDEIAAGEYIVIVSTFNAQEEGNFKLRVDSTAECRLVKLASDLADRFRVDNLGTISFPQQGIRMAAPLHIFRYFKMTAIAKVKLYPGQDARTASPLRLSIEIGRGVDPQHHAASNDGRFDSAEQGVRLDTNLWPDMAPGRDIWLVVERMAAPGMMNQESVKVELMVDVQRSEGWEIGVWRDFD